MADILLHSYVSGRVQGVWFRQSTKEKAIELGLVGWAKNLPDGRVEVKAFGEENSVRQLDAWLSQGPELANVADVNSEYLSENASFTDFDVL